jgi:shikimate kinase
MLRQTSFVAWLEADVATIQSRIASDPLSLSQRPALLPEKDSMETETMLLLRRRSPLYAAGSDIRLDATAKSPEELAAELCALYAKVLDGAANGKLQRGECAVRTEGEYEHDR